MTSVRHFGSWIKESGRGHVTAAVSWGGLFIYTVVSIPGLRGDADFFFGIGNENLFYLCILLGVLVSAAEFWYLEQPAKLDFYYSLPVKRGTVFWCRYVHGVLHVIVSLAVSMTALGIYGCRVDEDFLIYAGFYMFRSIIIFAAVFLTFYHIGIVSFLAGGRFVTVLVFFLLFTFSGQAVTEKIGRAYAAVYFKTFYRIPMLENIRETLTPGLLLRNLSGASLLDKREAFEYIPGQGTVLGAVLWVAVSFVLILYLERKRRVENVGRPFAFSGAERAFVFVLSVVPALCFGNLFTGSGILFVFLFHILSELFTGSCGKTIFKRKGQLILEGLTVLLAAGGFAAGAEAFDSFFPEKDELVAVRVCVNGVDMPQKEYAKNTSGEESYTTERLLARYKLTGEGMTEALLWLEGLERDISAGERAYTFVTVCYEGKNEKKKYRVYPVKEEEFQAFSEVFATKEYKEKAYPALLWENVGENSFIWKDGVRNHQILELSKEEKEEFLETYKEEVYAFQMEELRTEAPVGIVEMESDKWGETEELLIYPFLKKTYEFLLDHGEIKEELTDYPVRSLRVLNSRPAGEGVTGGVTLERCETEEELEAWSGRLAWEELDVQPILYPLGTGTEIEAEVEEPESGAVVTVKCREKMKR